MRWLRRFLGLGAAMWVAAWVMCARVSPLLADVASPHGFVEPCSVGFVEDNNTKCELCAPTPANPNLCHDTLGLRGYEMRCRTGGHSTPSEVWCIGAAPAKVSALTRYWLVLAVPVALFGAFLLLERRRRRR